MEPDDDLKPGEAWIEINGQKFKATNVQISHEPLELKPDCPPICSVECPLTIGGGAFQWNAAFDQPWPAFQPTHYTATVSGVPGVFVGSSPFMAMDKAMWAASMYQTLRDRLFVPRPKRLVAWLFPEDN